MHKPVKLSITLETLTPIHIGCDDYFQPTEFVIDTTEKVLIKFSIYDLIPLLNDKERAELERISEARGLLGLVRLYRFYKERLQEKIKKLPNVKKIKIPDELSKRYEEFLKLNDEKKIRENFNNFEIPRTFFNPFTDQPIIPGSSLKGSIRTAYLEIELKKSQGKIKVQELLNKIMNINTETKKSDIDKLSQELEKELLEYPSLQRDPFKYLKISDLTPINRVDTQIMYQVNVRKSGNRFARGITRPIEVIPAGVQFYGEMDFVIPQNIPEDQPKLKFAYFLEGLHTHFEPILNEEESLAKSLGFQKLKVTEKHLKLYKEKKGFFIKIGKHSGAEAVTIEGVRRILIRLTGNRKEYRDSPTTIWLASPKQKDISMAYPFGWAFMTIEKKKI